MTIGEKSTLDGVDYAQITLDANPLAKCFKGGVFHCFTLYVEDGATGENKKFYIKDSNGDIVHNKYLKWSDESLVENSTKIQIETAFKDYINNTEFIPIPVNTVTYQEII